ncbi:MAG TPA: GNAT family N-acetyltransferase [Candidatus Limnocylindria bacterium]|jgi:RimJ/RimL family protein N-acetyltransferase
MNHDVAPSVVRSERLAMPLLTADQLERMLAGDLAGVGAEIGAHLPAWWIQDRHWLLQLRLRQLREAPETGPWLLRPIVLADDEPVSMGLLNFHGPPDDRGFAEIGYELRPEFWGKGYATEAVRAMFDWAAAEHGVTRFRAGIAPDNQRSMNVVTRLGMRRVGAQWDDGDGLELLWTVEGWGLA